MPCSPSVDALTLRRAFNAPLQRVFDAWKNPDLLRLWLGGHQQRKLFADVDFRVGGQYRLDILAPSGNVYRLEGTYQEIEEPRRIVFTWDMGDSPPTLVTVIFTEREAQTLVTLTHERFHDAPTRALHEQGWTICFARLHELLTTP